MFGPARGPRVRRIVTLVSAGVLMLSACGGSGDDGEPRAGAGTEKRPNSSNERRSVTFAHNGGPAHIDLVALNRTSETTVTGRFTVVNDGRAPLDMAGPLGDQSNDMQAGGILTVSGIGLLDGRNNKLYMPLNTTDPTCLCSKLQTLAPGASAEIYAVFPAPPADVGRVTVTTPNAMPFQDVPLGKGPVPPLPDQIDPAKVQLREPRILPVLSVAEGVELGVNDNADDRSVQLSSDVLFAVNKADLTPRADALLRQVAQQINASKGTVVKVDGHADSTGNDAINQPLSERRAQAVADRLKGLVTRQGVAFQAAGHGSAQPIASNDSDEGRRKNRRVSVSFTRPVEAAPAAPAGKPYRPGDTTVLKSGRIEPAKELEFTVNSLHRDASGLTTLVWTIKNTGSAEAGAEHLERNSYLHGSAPRNRGWATGGVMLVDPATKTRYWPLETSVGHCQCYTFTPDAKEKLAPGESVVLWGIYKPPAQLRAVDLHIPWAHQVGATAPGLTIA